MKQYKGSIKRWLTAIIVLMTIFISTLAFVFFIYWYTDNQDIKTKELSRTVSDIIGQNVAKIILIDDVSAAADITSSLESFKHLDYMVLYNLNKIPVYQYSKDNESFEVMMLDKNVQERFDIKDNTAHVLSDASYQGTKLGYVLLEIEITSIYDVFKNNIYTLLFIFSFLFIISIILANFFAKKFTAPILKLVEFLEVVDLKQRIKDKVLIKSNNEYTHLYDEVNMMLDRIDKSNQASKIAAVAFETHNGMTITDKNHVILDVNESFMKITGYTKEDVLGNTPAVLKSGLQDDDFYIKMNDDLKLNNYWSGEIYNKHKDGTIFPEYLTIQSVLDEDDEVIYYVASFVDLTLQKKTEEKLSYIQKYDSLTGLVNKSLLIENIEMHINEQEAQEEWASLLLINVKDFKLVNEAFGYDKGDLLLQELAKRLEEVDDEAMVGRIGSDQFCIWFKEVHVSKEKTLIESKIYAEYIMNIITKPYNIKDTVINILVYIGIDIYKKDSTDANAIFQQTEAALHKAKEDDTNISFFNKDFQRIAQNQMDTYTQLLIAIEEDQFELYYQPQYDAKEKVYAVEALIRWNIEDDKVIYPDNFIPIAEKTGLIIDIGDIVISKACKQLSIWREYKEASSYEIAVNVSAKQFMHDSFIKNLTDSIYINNINPKLLKIELTESILVSNMQLVIEKMNELKEIGIQISLDDFGTGYSSLQYLKDLPLDQVKIDQFFVRNMLESKTDVAIIKSVLLMSETLDIDVIAEGVETKEHFDFLKDLGCEFFQGYYFSKPKKISDLKFN